MTDKLREAAQQALVVLCREVDPTGYWPASIKTMRKEAITALRAALAEQPDPELMAQIKDAERYRFLRENWFTMNATYHDDDVQLYLNSARYTNATTERLDAAIDAAMKGKS